VLDLTTIEMVLEPFLKFVELHAIRFFLSKHSSTNQTHLCCRECVLKSPTLDKK